MTRRWLVRAGDGATVGAILDALASADALADGRAFVGRRRALRADEPVAPGDEVTVFAPRSASAEPRVLGERDDVVAVFKPAALPTQADHRGARCLLSWAEQHLPGGPWHASSRLDVGVSGVVLLARAAASGRLAAARERGAYHRAYLALAARAPAVPSGVWDFPIGQGRDPRQRAVGGRHPEAAVTRFSLLALAPGGQALLRLEPRTGRTHQLRVHAAHARAPLLGDRLYGGPPRLTGPDGSVTPLDRIALHAWRVESPDEARNPWRVESPPDELQALWAALGGHWPALAPDDPGATSD